MRAEDVRVVNKQKCESMGGKVNSAGECKIQFDDYKCKNVGGEFRDGTCEIPKSKLQQIAKDVNGTVDGNFKPKKE